MGKDDYCEASQTFFDIIDEAEEAKDIRAEILFILYSTLTIPFGMAIMIFIENIRDKIDKTV